LHAGDKKSLFEVWNINERAWCVNRIEAQNIGDRYGSRQTVLELRDNGMQGGFNYAVCNEK